MIDESALEQQLIEVEKEEVALRQQIETAQDGARQRAGEELTFQTAQALLTTLRQRLDQPVSWELKRQFVKVLVAGIQIDTLFQDGLKHLVVNASYRFAPSVETCRGRGSCNKRNVSLKRECRPPRAIRWLLPATPYPCD